ncbi:hypothetical protein ACJIZ3_003936 [Penstemon smallii]|uniref:Transposase n=1 Tax=Penstemon smallii TaxID=265156 RepID=A0ABD3S0P4_9LAMI
MRGTASLRAILRELKPTYSSKGRWVGTMTPRKQTNDNANEAHIEKDKAQPIAAFSRPPPFHPFLGPLVALSMLESWTKRDNCDD